MAKERPLTHPRRGEVYVVRFDRAEGAEIKKTRPALILQNEIGNKHSPATIVAAISSRAAQTIYPVDVLVATGEGGLDRESVIKLDQLRTIDKARLMRRLGKLKPATMRQVDQAVQISLGLIDL